MGTNVLTGPWGQQCTAKSKRSQERCKNAAMVGTNVCRMHGGKIPVVQERAAERAARIEDRVKELGDRAVATVREILEDDSVKPEVRIRAAETVLDRLVGKKIEAEVTRHDERKLDDEIAEELGELPEPADDGDLDVEQDAG